MSTFSERLEKKLQHLPRSKNFKWQKNQITKLQKQALLNNQAIINKAWVEQMKAQAGGESPDLELVEAAIEAVSTCASWATFQLTYFIVGGDAVKIGIAKKVNQRLVDIQVGCPNKLRIARVFQGGARLEERLHGLLWPLHMNGEWFKLCPTVWAIIDQTEAWDVQGKELDYTL